jgi:hypothetical protein
MTMPLSKRPRAAAGAFLLLAFAALGASLPAPAAAAERVRFALEREGGVCPTPADGTVWGLAPAPATSAERRDVAGCILQLKLEGLGDAELGSATTRLATASSSPGVILALPGSEVDRIAYAIKLLSSAFRGASPAGLVGLDLEGEMPEAQVEELAPYVDALVRHPGETFPEDSSRREWLLAVPSVSGSPATIALSALATAPRATLVALPRTDRPVTEADAAALARLQRYFTTDV